MADKTLNIALIKRVYLQGEAVEPKNTAGEQTAVTVPIYQGVSFIERGVGEKTSKSANWPAPEGEASTNPPKAS